MRWGSESPRWLPHPWLVLTFWNPLAQAVPQDGVTSCAGVLVVTARCRIQHGSHSLSSRRPGQLPSGEGPLLHPLPTSHLQPVTGFATIGIDLPPKVEFPKLLDVSSHHFQPPAPSLEGMASPAHQPTPPNERMSPLAKSGLGGPPLVS